MDVWQDTGSRKLTVGGQNVPMIFRDVVEDIFGACWRTDGRKTRAWSSCFFALMPVCFSTTLLAPSSKLDGNKINHPAVPLATVIYFRSNIPYLNNEVRCCLLSRHCCFGLCLCSCCPKQREWFFGFLSWSFSCRQLQCSRIRSSRGSLWKTQSVKP